MQFDQQYQMTSTKQKYQSCKKQKQGSKVSNVFNFKMISTEEGIKNKL